MLERKSLSTNLMNSKNDIFRKSWPCVIVKYGNAFTSYPIDLPGCGATATTREESLKCLSKALTLHLLGMLEDGDYIPEPENSHHNTEDGSEIVYVLPS